MVQSIFKSCLLSLLGLIRLVAAFGRFRSATTEISNGFKNSNLGLPLYMIAISHCFRFPAVFVNSLALIVSQCKALEHVIGVVPQRIRMQSTCCCCNRQSRLIQSLRLFVCHKIHKDSVLFMPLVQSLYDFVHLAPNAVQNVAPEYLCNIPKPLFKHNMTGALNWCPSMSIDVCRLASEEGWSESNSLKKSINTHVCCIYPIYQFICQNSLTSEQFTNMEIYCKMHMSCNALCPP